MGTHLVHHFAASGISTGDAARAQGRLVGLGLAMYVEVCGLGPSSSLPTGGWEHSQVTIERDGRISATTGASPHGQGNETTFAQMLADQFSVPIEHIRILHGDTGVVKQGIGTFGSRSQAVGGTALHLAGAKVKSKMAKYAAAMLEAHEDDIVFERARSASRDRRRPRSRSRRLPRMRTCRFRCRRASNRA